MKISPLFQKGRVENHPRFQQMSHQLLPSSKSLWRAVALERAKAFKFEKPSFALVSMKPSHINHRFVVSFLWQSLMAIKPLAKLYLQIISSVDKLLSKDTYCLFPFHFKWLPSEFTMLVRPLIENSGDDILRVSDGRVRTWQAN